MRRYLQIIVALCFAGAIVLYVAAQFTAGQHHHEMERAASVLVLSTILAALCMWGSE